MPRHRQTSALDLFEKHLLTERRQRPNTFIAYRGKLRRLEEFTGKEFTTGDRDERLTVRDLRDFIRAHPELARDTINQTVSAAKAWEKFGELEGWWRANGILAYSVPSEPSEPPLPLPAKHVDTLLGSVRTAREIRIVFQPLFAGVRISDAEALGADNYLQDRLRFRIIKTGRMVDLPLHPELEAVRDQVLTEPNGTPPQALKHVYRRLRDRVGFQWSPKDLRATYADRHLHLGAREEVLEQLLGHAPRSLARKHYGRLPWWLLEETQRALYYERFGPQQMTLW